MDIASADTAPKMVTGDFLGVPFPTSIEALLEGGPDFLTRAFHATGALAADNRVLSIDTWREVVLGGMGRKLALSVTYARPDPGLHTELFIKFQRDFGDPLRAMFGPWMAPEIRFALLSRQPGFPITVPECCFADFHAESLSGLLITERISYGANGIEPCPTKGADYELADPLPYYHAITRAMARLAAHHRRGGFGDAIEREFPVAEEHAPALTVEALHEKLGEVRNFARAYPQLFCDGLDDPAFLQAFSEDALLVLELAPAISRHVAEQADYIGLCHPNLNLDNAWFWTDAEGLQVGLLDWGNVGQMSFAHAMIGMICTAETGFIRDHHAGLVGLFVEEFARASGVRLDAAKLDVLIRLTLPLLAVPWIIDIPALIERLVPDLATVKDRFDPRIKDEIVARNQLQGLMVTLTLWREGDVGGLLRAFDRVPSSRA
ncbi:MAG: hypothetical protein KGN34_05995 [Sphingomonadales bacterium]|nr:hypothetical protein [Sphingomonadales bacterium]